MKNIAYRTVIINSNNEDTDIRHRHSRNNTKFIGQEHLEKHKA